MDFARYNFNPFQFTPPDELMLDFHRRHAAYFDGCTKVLDLGAGRGFFLRELQARGISAVGVESHEPSMAIGRRAGLEYFSGDIFGFFRSAEGRALAATCDGVYCAHVLEHLQPEEIFELFRLVKECCRPGVRCRFITNNPADIDVLGGVFLMDLTHQRLYPPALLVAMARSQGFEHATADVFLGMKLGKRDRLRRVLQRPFWGKHKWHPNLRLDCS